MYFFEMLSLRRSRGLGNDALLAILSWQMLQIDLACIQGARPTYMRVKKGFKHTSVDKR